jgi:hypothetical protein
VQGGRLAEHEGATGPSLGLAYQSLLNKEGGNRPGFHQEFAVYRAQLDQTLYYRLLKRILVNEAKIKSEKEDVTDVLLDEAFNSSLFACAMQIVLFSFNSTHRFP